MKEIRNGKGVLSKEAVPELVVIEDQLHRGTAGWQQGVLREKGLSLTFLAEYLPRERLGGYLCKGIDI